MQFENIRFVRGIFDFDYPIFRRRHLFKVNTRTRTDLFGMNMAFSFEKDYFIHK